MKRLIFVLLTLVLTACGGGGGGGGSSSSPSAPGDGSGGGGGGSSGGNGQASFYALSGDGLISPLENIASPSGAYVVSNKFYVDVSNATTGVLEVGVYQPTCLNGASYTDYGLVLMSGTGVSMISIQVLSTGARVELLSYDNNLTQKRKLSSSVVSGTCTNGKMTLTDGSVIYSNGSAIVYRDSTSNLYVGLSSTNSFNPVSHTGTDISSENAGGTQVATNNYTHWEANEPLLGTSNQGSEGGYEDNGTFFGVFNGAVSTSMGNGTAYVVNNSTVDVSSYHSVVKGSGMYSARELRSVSGLIDGKLVHLGTMSNTCTTHTGSYTYCSGVDATYLAIEQ
jgi:hypothetical protein